MGFNPEGISELDDSAIKLLSVCLWCMSYINTACLLPSHISLLRFARPESLPRAERKTEGPENNINKEGLI